MSESKNSIVITGASSGLGAALAIKLAGPGRVLALIGRDQARLEGTAILCRAKGAECVVATFDLRDRPRMEAFLSDLDSRYPIEFLVANAGIFMGRRSDELIESEENARAVLEINLIATVDLVNAVLPCLLNRKRGRILILASLAGLFPLPDAAAYSASKSSLLSFGLALRGAVASEGVSVVVACPGYVTTPMVANHRGARPGEVPLDAAVEKIIKGVEKNRAVIAFPLHLYLLGRLFLLFPERIRRQVTMLMRFHFS